MTACPCCSKRAYDACCGQYLDGQQLAPNPEALMRSRYTAYSLGKLDYIESTMRGQALSHFNKEQAKNGTESISWQKLEVHSAIEHGDEGFVTFTAYFDNDGRSHTMHERSAFIKEAGVWYYIGHAGPLKHALPKVGRNDPCSCGSGRKYKKCCMHSS